MITSHKLPISHPSGIFDYSDYLVQLVEVHREIQKLDM
jgi:hypothetical protein